MHVIVTGATGNVGNAVIRASAFDSGVGEIVALARPVPNSTNAGRCRRSLASATYHAGRALSASKCVATLDVAHRPLLLLHGWAGMSSSSPETEVKDSHVRFFQ